MPRKSSSPDQAKRAVLAQQIRARGESAHNIWVVKPPFEDDIYLSSDGAHELFYFIEGEFQYQEISYRPLRVTSGSNLHDDLRFAEVVTRGGLNQTIYLKRSPELVDDANCRRVDLAMLTANAMRVENWRRIVPCIRRVQIHPIAVLERGIFNALRDGQHRSIRQVFSALGGPSVPLAVGAIATLLRKRMLVCDCDTRPWSWQTMIGISTP